MAKAGIDTLVMKHFLSGFSDDDAKLILKHCGQVLPRSGEILLLQVSFILCVYIYLCIFSLNSILYNVVLRHPYLCCPTTRSDARGITS